MSRSLWCAIVMIALVAPAQAQNGREYFTTPDTALDVGRAPQQQAFMILRDSTSTISAAGAKLMRDMSPSSSLALMRARAQAIVTACARSEGPLSTAQMVTTQGVWPNTAQQKAQSELLKEMTSFAGDLTDCQKRWTAFAADTSQVSFRENAPYQMKLLQNRLDAFNRTVQTYLRYIDVKLPLKGQSAS